MNLDDIFALLVYAVAFLALLGTSAGIVAVGEWATTAWAEYRRWRENRPVTTSERGL